MKKCTLCGKIRHSRDCGYVDPTGPLTVGTIPAADMAPLFAVKDH